MPPVAVAVAVKVKVNVNVNVNVKVIPDEDDHLSLKRYLTELRSRRASATVLRLAGD